MTLKSFIKKILLFVKSRDYRVIVKSKLGFYNKYSDERYLKIMFKTYLHRDLNLDNPRTFNEKIQWLKIHDRNPNYTNMVDKYEAKRIVASLVGDEYIIPTLGVFNSFSEIDFSKLPDRFVMKCTHDSGGLVICRDKNNLDVKKARKKINKALKRNFYLVGREWPYKDVKPRIIVEKYMEDSCDCKDSNCGLTDYKFYCFNGEPKFLYMSKNLEDHFNATITFISMDWKKESFERTDYKSLDSLPEPPSLFDDMIRVAKILSKGIKFVRVDLYCINNQVYFSELTFHPSSGFMVLKDPNDDRKIGELLDLY